MNRDEAITRITKYIKYKGNSSHTLSQYLFCLNHFFDFIDCDDISSLTPDHCIDYIIYLKENDNYAPASLNVFIASFRLLFDVVLSSPLSKRQLPSLILPETETIIFSHDQIQLLLDHANYKMKAMIFLGFDCGLRVSEVANLRCQDIDSDHMLIHIRNSKRGKSRTVKLSKNTLTALRTYWLRYAPGRNYLFPSARGDGHMNPSSINNNFRRLLDECGLYDKAYRFHCLRHTYATKLLHYGCDQFLLKKLLGHKSLSSTARYIRIDTTDVESSFCISDMEDFSYE